MARLKLWMFCFNAISALIGLLVFEFGCYLYEGYHRFRFDELSSSAPFLIMLIGAIIMCIAYLGLLALFSSSDNILSSNSIHANVSLIMLILEIWVILYSYFKPVEFQQAINQILRTKLENYAPNRQFWHFLQNQLTCCGVFGPSDWTKLFQQPVSPSSCCRDIGEYVKTCNPESAYQLGCGEGLISVLHANGLIIYPIFLIVMTFQVISIVYPFMPVTVEEF